MGAGWVCGVVGLGLGDVHRAAGVPRELWQVGHCVGDGTGFDCRAELEYACDLASVHIAERGDVCGGGAGNRRGASNLSLSSDAEGSSIGKPAESSGSSDSADAPGKGVVCHKRHRSTEIPPQLSGSTSATVSVKFHL